MDDLIRTLLAKEYERTAKYAMAYYVRHPDCGVDKNDAATIRLALTTIESAVAQAASRRTTEAALKWSR